MKIKQLNTCKFMKTWKCEGQNGQLNAYGYKKS